MWNVPVPPVVRILCVAVIGLTLGVFVLPTLFLSYKLTSDGFVIKTAQGHKTIKKSDIKAVSVTEFKLGIRIFGTGAMAYYVGNFQVDPIGRMEVFTGHSNGTGVVLTLSEGPKVLLSPVDPRQFVNALTDKQ